MIENCCCLQLRQRTIVFWWETTVFSNKHLRTIGLCLNYVNDIVDILQTTTVFGHIRLQFSEEKCTGYYTVCNQLYSFCSSSFFEEIIVDFRKQQFYSNYGLTKLSYQKEMPILIFNTFGNIPYTSTGITFLLKSNILSVPFFDIVQRYEVPRREHYLHGPRDSQKW